MYIATIILGIYFLFFGLSSLKKTWAKILASSILLIGLSAFWILPFLSGGFSMAISDVAERGLFANAHYSIERSLALFHPYWTGAQPTVFILQSIPWYFWIIPVFAILFFFFRPDKENKKIITFFGIVWLAGLFLTKQVGEPLPSAFQWLRDNIPGFMAFRSGSKFWFVLSFGYMGLLSFGLLWLKNERKRLFFVAISAVIIILSLWNLRPLIMGSFGGMFAKREIPKDYLILSEYFFQKKDFFRTFWIPSNSRWGFYSNQKPAISNVGIIETEWKNFLEMQNANEKIIQNRIMNVFKLQLADNLFDNSSIKYVIVPIQDIADDDDFFIYYGGKDNPDIRDWYIAELDKISWLKKIDIGTQELVVYENENYKQHIYSDNGLNYSQTNASEFGDFSQNQNLYLNSDIDKNNFLLNNLDNIIVPVEADPNKIAEMKSVVDKTTDAKEKKKLQDDLDLYANNLFFKDYKLQIPVKASYKIYFKKDSVLANNKNVGIKINGKASVKNEPETSREGWKYFNQIEMEKGEYDFKVYIDNVLIDTINSGDIVLSAENLAKEIEMPQLEYRQINPAKYIVNVHGASESFPLIFSESFHPGWKIYPAELKIENYKAIKSGDEFISENNQGTIQNENLDGGRFYDLLFRKSVIDDKHFIINGFANAWWIDMNEVCGPDFRLRGNNKIVCAKNIDGLYDFSITIEFEPQKYFYVGLLISGLAFLGCLGYLLRMFIVWVYNNKNKKTIIKMPN